MTLDAAAGERAIRRGRVILLLGLLALVGVYIVALDYSPADKFQGMVFKTIYLHVPAAVAMEVGFVLVGIVSILVLWLKDPKLDIFAEASAEVAMVFATVVLLTGPIWGRSAWGTWWAWEPRLTFTLLLYLVFAGYFALRGTLRDPGERARFSAVVGIMALFLVPFIHLSVYLFKSQHPPPVLLRPPTNDPDAPHLAWSVSRTILLSMGVFMIMWLGFVLTRYGVGVRRAAEEMQDA